MKKYYLLETEEYTSKPKKEYRRTAMFTGIGRVIGFALMFGSGFVAGQVIRGLIIGILRGFGII